MASLLLKLALPAIRVNSSACSIVRGFSASSKLLSEIKKGLLYSKHHEWLAVDDKKETCSFGITDYAQDQLGDVVFCELPAESDSFSKEDVIGTIESVKAVSDIYTPITGSVVEINSKLEDKPSLVNESPYDDGWLVKLKIEDKSELDELMDADKYEDFVKTS